MVRFALILSAWLSISCGSAPQWIAEDESGIFTLEERGDTLEIIAPKGLTLWYTKPFKGDYRINYTATVVMAGGEHDRLADLNCFWAAKDPHHSDDLFARSAWRAGVFSNYNTLDLFYVGFGGNHNTTTRFRRYYGDRFGELGAEVKPLIAEYTSSDYLLFPNRSYRIEITVAGGKTTFAVDGIELFARSLSPDEGNGYFGLRLLSNHTLIVGLNFEHL